MFVSPFLFLGVYSSFSRTTHTCTYTRIEAAQKMPSTLPISAPEANLPSGSPDGKRYENLPDPEFMVIGLWV
jgi:hypothetical protein